MHKKTFQSLGYELRLILAFTRGVKCEICWQAIPYINIYTLPDHNPGASSYHLMAESRTLLSFLA